MTNSRRDFIKKTSMAGVATYIGTLGMSAKSYGRIIGANERVNVGVLGFSDRFKDALLPSFLDAYKTTNFDIIAVSDIWKKEGRKARDFLNKKWITILHPTGTMKNCWRIRKWMPSSLPPPISNTPCIRLKQ